MCGLQTYLLVLRQFFSAKVKDPPKPLLFQGPYSFILHVMAVRRDRPFYGCPVTNVPFFGAKI